MILGSCISPSAYVDGDCDLTSLLSRKEEDLYQAILKMLDESGTSGHKFVTASYVNWLSIGSLFNSSSLGHLLLSLGEKPQQPSLLSPLRGRMPLPQILKWLQSVKTQMTFVPR